MLKNYNSSLLKENIDIKILWSLRENVKNVEKLNQSLKCIIEQSV